MLSNPLEQMFNKAQAIGTVMFEEQPGQTSSWREETNPCITNWNMGDGYQDTWKHDSGWGWESHQDSYEVPNNQGVSYGHWTHWRRRNNEPGRNSNRIEREDPSAQSQ
jgi:hypothetical protein